MGRCEEKSPEIVRTFGRQQKRPNTVTGGHTAKDSYKGSF